MSIIDEVRARTDIVELVGETVKLRKSGNSYTGFCPFHDNKRTPAFVIWPDSGTWRCFGACAEGGSVFDYVMKRDNVDFPESLQILAARAGIELEPHTPADAEKEDHSQHLRQLLQQAITYYQHLLLNAPAAAIVRQQLAGRGISAQAIEEFELGYALNEWDAAQRYFHEKGYTDEELLAVGLLTQNEQGRIYDRFRHRIIIPIRDDRGRPAGFGARVVDPDDIPKYLNSPQSELFNKSMLLYGLDRAKKSIRESGTAVIVEGYMDVIATHQAGHTNTIAPMGTALTETQLRLIRRTSRRMVLALDADAAGLKATLRGLETARQTLDREAVPTFDPRGLLRTEGRLQLDIRVAALPPGLDPDDVIQQDADAWPNLIANALPVAEYIMQALSEGQNLDDPKIVADIASQVMPVIAEVNDPVERGIYRQKLARLLNIDERSLMQWQPEAQPPARTPRPTPTTQAATLIAQPRSKAAIPDAATRERYCLGALTRFPDLLPRIDRAMHQAELAPLDKEDFTQTELQLIFQALQAALQQDKATPKDYLRTHLDGSLLDVLIDSENSAKDLVDTNPVHIADLKYSIFLIRKASIGRWLGQMHRQQTQAEERGDAEQASLFQKEIVVNTIALNKVSRALGGKTQQPKAQTH